MIWMVVFLGICIAVIAFAIYKVVTIQSAYNNGVKTSFHERDGVLYIENRGSFWKNFIKITKVKNYHLGYEPEKLHYGSATVGGVTSGGFYTTGGYNKVTSESNSGKYKLEFAGDASIINNTIRVISFSTAVFEEALHSPIAKYLDTSSHCIEMFRKVHRTKEETDVLLKNAMDLATGKPLISGVAMDDTRGYPTYEKCKEIFDWICGK